MFKNDILLTCYVVTIQFPKYSETLPYGFLRNSLRDTRI